jgi:hypothetical protein
LNSENFQTIHTNPQIFEKMKEAFGENKFTFSRMEQQLAVQKVPGSG